MTDNMPEQIAVWLQASDLLDSALAGVDLSEDRRSRLIQELAGLQPLGCGMIDLPEWLVYGMIGRTAVGQLIGESRTGKTLLALDLARAVACADTDQWFGQDIDRHGQVLYLAFEGGSGLEARFRAACGMSGTGTPRKHQVLARELPPSWVLGPEPVDVADTALLARATEAVLIIVDTQSAWSGRAGLIDENSNSQMARVLTGVIDLAQQADAAVVLVTHTSYAGTDAGSSATSRGASAQRGNLDFAITTSWTGKNPLDRRERNPEGNLVVGLRVTKCKEGTDWDTARHYEIAQWDAGTDRRGRRQLVGAVRAYDWAAYSGELSGLRAQQTEADHLGRLERDETFARLYSEGQSLKQIASAAGVSPTTVSTRLLAQGVTLRSPGRPKTP